MRILITPKGEEEINQLRNLHKNYSSSSLFRNFQNNKAKRRSSSVILRSGRETKRQSLIEKLNQSLMNDIEINSKSTSNLIKINNKKVNPFYDRKDRTSVSQEQLNRLKVCLLPKEKLIQKEFGHMIEKIINKKEPQFSKKVPLKDIISKSAYQSVINKIKNEKITNRKNFVMTDRDFRTTVEESKIKKVDQLLKCEINRKRENFINYLKSKDKIGIGFVERVSKMSEQDLYNMNQLCYLMKKKREKELKDKEFRENLKKEITENIRTQARMDIDDVKEDMRKTKELLNKPQNQPEVNKLKIILKHQDLKNKYWKRNNIEHLQRTGNRELFRKTSDISLIKERNGNKSSTGVFSRTFLNPAKSDRINMNVSISIKD